MIFTKTQFPTYKIGSHSYGTITIHGGDKDSITIGDYCSFAPGLELQVGGDHWTDFVSNYPFPHAESFTQSTQVWPAHIEKREPFIHIGNDVWTGLRVIVRHGVTIGDGAVVGMGSVVLHDVPPYAIVAGNPAKLIRYRFKPEQIEKLLQIKWWNWTEGEIRQRMSLMSDIDKFISEFS